jgi:DNA polymerase I-like protein with 3'-5' exonuclease and polymerase domains
MKCPTCGGKKKRTEEYPVYTDPYPLIGRNGVAGAIFRAADLPSRLDEFGVEYIVPTYHPSFCLRPVTGSKRNADGERAIGGQFAARVLAEHLAKARRLLSSETRWQDPKPLWTRDPDVVARWLAAPGRYSVDIETNSYDGPEAVTQIVCIGFARRDREEALVIDTRHLPTALEGAELDDPILHALRAFFARDDVETVYWNGLYDRYVMWRLWRVWDHAFANDGKAAHNALWPDEEHTLAFAAHELLDAPHWKDPGKKIPSGEYDDLSGYPDEDSLALYNARDCRATLELDTVFRGPPGSRGLLHEEDVLAAWQSDVNNYELALRMQVAGMPLNLATRRELEAGFLDRIRGLEAKMANIVGRSADDWSPTGGDLAWALFDPDGPLRLPVLATTATGKPSTEKSLLKRLVGQAPEFIPTYLKWKAETYNLSHYVQGAGLEPGPDGRLHPTWKPGLRTGRWSSTPNLQNWPYRNPELNMRKLIEAPPGRVLVGADYAQLELRIMAALAGDPKLIALINNADEARKLEADYDPHSYLARAVFGKAWTEAPKGDRKRLRDTVKRVWYGSLYGAGATTIIDSILDSDYAGPPLTVPFVEGVLRMISTEFEGVQRWRQRAWETMQQEHAVFSPLTGRRRIFPLGQLEITVAYNYPIQSGAGDIVNERAWILDDRLVDVDPTAAIIAQVHDALYVECAEDRAEAVAACVTDTLTIERAFLEGAPPMRFDAQAEIGQRWDQV